MKFGDFTAVDSVNLNIKRERYLDFRFKWMWKNYNNEDVNRTLNPSSGTVKLLEKSCKKAL